jgi:hypothetical protein
MISPIFFGLPSPAEIDEAPQRAILAALDANLVLAVRALKAQHPSLDDCDLTRDPLLLLAEGVVASALSLHNILEAYDYLAKRSARLDHGDEPPDGPLDSHDLPF